MPHYYHPPQPYFGGGQPLTVKKLAPANELVPDAFFDTRRQWLSVSRAYAAWPRGHFYGWEPGPPIRRPGTSVSGGVAAPDAPPPSHPSRQQLGRVVYQTIATWWEPGPPLPVLRPRIILSGPLPDFPQFGHPTRQQQWRDIYQTIRGWWEPPPPLPTLGQKLVFPGATADFPPPYAGYPLALILRSFLADPPIQRGNRVLFLEPPAPPSQVLQPLEPPIGPQWILPAVLPYWSGALVQSGPTPDNPPFGSPQVIWPAIYEVIRSSWEPIFRLPPSLAPRVFLSAVIPDNPPLGYPTEVFWDLYSIILQWWVPGPPLPTLNPKVIPPPPPAPDNPIFGYPPDVFQALWATIEQQSWLLIPGPPPILPRKLTPSSGIPPLVGTARHNVAPQWIRRRRMIFGV